jgi:uracil-DNA glycosylase
MSETLPNPFAFTRGPRDAEVLIVGEAWGSEEELRQQPFMGAAGNLLNKLLGEAGIDPSTCLFANVVDQRPGGNEFTNFLYPASAKESPFHGVHARPVLSAGVRKLYRLAVELKPKLIVACGNWPFWAFSDRVSIGNSNKPRGFKVPTGVGNWRGSQLFTTRGVSTPIPLLPVYHPALILRDYTSYYPTLHDLKSKVHKALQGKWEVPPLPGAIPKPTFETVEFFLRSWFDSMQTGIKVELSTDIETYRRRHITVIGISDGVTHLCIPFFYFEKGGVYKDYWTLEEEHKIVWLLKRVLEHPNAQIIGQNYAYDYQFMLRTLGIKAPPAFDTMVMHHLCWPGTPRGLDYLSSLYCEDHVYWKEESEDWDGKGEPESLWGYNCLDTAKTFEIAQVLKNLIHKLGLDDQAREQMEFWVMAQGMARRGTAYSNGERERIKKELLAVGSQIGEFLLGCMPPDLRHAPSGKPWYTSPQHTAYIFYQVLKIAPVLHKQTKLPTTDATSFETLKKRAPYLRACIDALQQLRSISVYEKNFLSTYTGYDGRMRCHFDIAGTDTFRWSSSKNGFGEGGNLQNIPE